MEASEKAPVARRLRKRDAGVLVPYAEERLTKATQQMDFCRGFK